VLPNNTRLETGQCVKKCHPWKQDSGKQHFYFTITVIVISCVLGAIVLWLAFVETCWVGNAAARMHNAVHAAAASAVHTAGQFVLHLVLLLPWFFAELLFRTAPYAAPAVPWPHKYEKARVFFYRFILLPHEWWLQLLAVLLVALAVVVYINVDLKHLRPQSAAARQRAVAPSTGDKRPVTPRLLTSVGAWLLLYPGRLVSSPLFVPAAYLLLNAFLCFARRTKAELHFVTQDCDSVFQCYTFWHWCLMVFCGVVLVVMTWAYFNTVVPREETVGFGLPYFLLFTIPIRLVLSWAGKLLIHFSVCWSLFTVLWCNIALLLLMPLAHRALNTSAVTLAVLFLVDVWCVIAGSAAVYVYFHNDLNQSCTIEGNCTAAIIVFVIAVVLLLVAVIMAWVGCARCLPRRSDDAGGAVVTPYPRPPSRDEGRFGGVGIGGVGAIESGMISTIDVASHHQLFDTMELESELREAQKVTTAVEQHTSRTLREIDSSDATTPLAVPQSHVRASATRTATSSAAEHMSVTHSVVHESSAVSRGVRSWNDGGEWHVRETVQSTDVGGGGGSGARGGLFSTVSGIDGGGAGSVDEDERDELRAAVISDPVVNLHTMGTSATPTHLSRRSAGAAMPLTPLSVAAGPFGGDGAVQRPRHHRNVDDVDVSDIE
jgi:hypothetical protein